MSSEPLSKNDIRRHLKRVWTKAGDCQVCGSNAWVVLEDEYQISERDKGAVSAVAVVRCDNCGAMLFFDSSVISAKLD